MWLRKSLLEGPTHITLWYHSLRLGMYQVVHRVMAKFEIIVYITDSKCMVFWWRYRRNRKLSPISYVIYVLNILRIRTLIPIWWDLRHKPKIQDQTIVVYTVNLKSFYYLRFPDLISNQQKIWFQSGTYEVRRAQICHLHFSLLGTANDKRSGFARNLHCKKQNNLTNYKSSQKIVIYLSYHVKKRAVCWNSLSFFTFFSLNNQNAHLLYKPRTTQ